MMAACPHGWAGGYDCEVCRPRKSATVSIVGAQLILNSMLQRLQHGFTDEERAKLNDCIDALNELSAGSGCDVCFGDDNG